MANIKYNFGSDFSGSPKKKTGKVFFAFLAAAVILGGIMFWLHRKNAEPVNEISTPDKNVKIAEKPTASGAENTVSTPTPNASLQNIDSDTAEIGKAVADTDYQKAKLLSLKLLEKCNDPSKSSQSYRKIAKLLTKLNLIILYQAIPGASNERYVVQSGDNLNNIAIKYNLPVSAIQKANKIKGAVIYPGQVLTIYKGDWRIEVNKEAKMLYVFDGDNLFTVYDIGIGKEGRTPEGDFILSDKIEHPDWYSPDGRIVPYGEKDNVLGTHWLKLTPAGDTDATHIGYGIHGTWDEGSITKSVSNGCIRMINQEVEELFNYIPRQTKVKIY